MDPSRPNLIFDLDNTILSAVASEDYLWDNAEYKKALSKLVTHNMDDTYVVHERPGLQKFLDFCFANFNVHVWTAASQSYAAYIVANLMVPKESKRTLGCVFCSYHGRKSKKLFNGPKNLKLFFETWQLPGMSPENTFIMDDHPGVKADNKQNAIHVIEFEVDPSSFSSDKNSLASDVKKMLKKEKYLSIYRKNLESYLEEFKKNKKVANPSDFFPDQQTK